MSAMKGWSRTPRIFFASTILCMAVAVTGCADLCVSDRVVEGVVAGALDPHHFVFVCHGMLMDLGIPWDLDARDRMADRGRVGLVVTYWSDPTGVILNWGCVAPGDLIAAVADALCEAHDACACEEPLRFSAVAFSNGCEALIRSAERAQRARFDRWVFVQSSSISFSEEVSELIAEGRVREVRNYWSPVDLITLAAPLGAGNLGLRGPGVENIAVARLHLPFFSDGFIEEMVGYVAEGAESSGPHDCRHVMASSLRRLRTRMR